MAAYRRTHRHYAPHETPKGPILSRCWKFGASRTARRRALCYTASDPLPLGPHKSPKIPKYILTWIWLRAGGLQPFVRSRGVVTYRQGLIIVRIAIDISGPAKGRTRPSRRRRFVGAVRRRIGADPGESGRAFVRGVHC